MSKKSKYFIGRRYLTLKVLSFILVIFLLGTQSSFAALESYMSINSDSLGVVEGDTITQGREGMHVIYDIQHQIEVPIDPNSGNPTGVPIHNLFMITTHLGKGTPELYEMLMTGDRSDITIEYYRIDAAGREVNYFTVTLEDAVIIDILHEKPDVIDENNKPYHDMISLSFSYRKITWTYQVDGVSYGFTRQQIN